MTLNRAEWEKWRQEAFNEAPPSGGYTNGNGHHQDHGPEEPAQPLPLIDIRQWQDVTPKPRQWIVPERIPDHNVTLLTGHGGVGKTLLMQQMSVATVIGGEWLGTLPEPGPVLFITAEDDEDEMHFRYDRIAKHYNTTFNILADKGLCLLSLAGKDATIAGADNRGVVRPTHFFDMLSRTVDDIRPRWIALDTTADIFNINERERVQVRQCISLMRSIALDYSTAVILLSHPSLTGIATGTGLSGSTAWNNSVRSRLYLTVDKGKADDDEDEEIDPNSPRLLEFMKSNYSALAKPVRLKWRDGLLLPDTVASPSGYERAASEDQAQTIFLQLLDRYNGQDRTVSPKAQANNYAPTEFAGQAEAKPLHKDKGRRKQMFKTAMDALFAANKIRIDLGPKFLVASRRTEAIYRRYVGE